MTHILPVFKTPIVLAPMPDGMLAEIRGVISFFFPSPVSHYVSMDTEDYRSLVCLAQLQLEHRGIHSRFAAAYAGLFAELLPGVRHIDVQVPRLRAARPHITGIQENIGWHRESMYGQGGEINIWIPIDNVCVTTAMLYISGSDKISDKDLETAEVVDESCARESPGHYIGLLDIEQKITGGVDFDLAMPLVVLPGEAALFDGRLIHGAGRNLSDALRFSVDFRVVGDLVSP